MKIVEVPCIGPVQFCRHPQSKNIRITIKSDRSVRVSFPRFCTFGRARSFITSRVDWVQSQLEKINETPPLEAAEVESLRAQAQEYIPLRVAEFAASAGFEYGHVRIKNISSRWGSCSVRKNLNFSLYLMRLEPRYIDYVIWHELCHTEHMNHGPAFWALLEKVCPSAKQRDKEMRKFRLGI